ncbi:MAG: hypothetical protein [Microvirus sp.]|nr:MAG: hypothetical protein [Microvirus sp.]
MEPVHALVVVYLYPLANFVLCLVGKCAPVIFPWA